jgi:phage shock protein A
MSAFPTPPPPAVENTEPSAASDGPSETEQLQERIRRYRAEYADAKAKVERLERKVAELTKLATEVYADGNSASATLDADIVKANLNVARGDLEDARRQLAGVEERARLDGVGYGQLY